MNVNVKPSIDIIKNKIKNVGDKIGKMKIANKKCSILLEQWVLQNFKTQGGKVGGWEPFKYGGRINNKGIGTLTTIAAPWGIGAIDVHVDKSAKLLQDTGALRRSYHPWYNNRNAGIGSDLPYSKAHNEGNSRLPQRRMLPESKVDDNLMLKFKQVYESHVKESIKI